MRLLPEPDVKTRLGILKCLINFSQDKIFVTQLCGLNFAQRIYELLKDNVKQDLSNDEGANAKNSAMMNVSHGVFDIVKKDV